MQLVLSYETAAIPYVLVFNENVLRQCPGLVALWYRDDPLEDLSETRRNTTFGCINKMMRRGWNDET
jgi:hypothetical protein